jgi:cation transporter-like permease
MPKKSPIHRFVELFVMISVLIILLGKLFFSSGDVIYFLLAYGILITLVLWITFFIAFVFYRDPCEKPNGGGASL